MQKVLVFFLGIFLVVGLLVWWSYKPVKQSKKQQPKKVVKKQTTTKVRKPKIKKTKVSKDKYTVSYYKNGTLVSAGTINTVSIPDDYSVVKKTKNTTVIKRGSDTYVYDKND